MCSRLFQGPGVKVNRMTQIKRTEGQKKRKKNIIFPGCINRKEKIIWKRKHRACGRRKESIKDPCCLL